MLKIHFNPVRTCLAHGRQTRRALVFLKIRNKYISPIQKISPKKIIRVQHFPFSIDCKAVMTTINIGKKMLVNPQDLKHPDSSQYVNSLLKQIEAIRELEQLKKGEKRDRIKHFMISVGELFLDHFQRHPQIAQGIAEPHKEALAKVVPLIQENYVAKLEEFLQGTFEGYGEWKLACQQRTNIEAFNSMFGNLILSFDTEQIDEYLQERKNSEGIDQREVPANIPKSHWWWFAS